MFFSSPPRHVAKLDGDPEDGGGVGADGRLRCETQQNQIFDIYDTSVRVNGL